MTILVTGATGHVGTNLVPALLERGRKVRVLVHRIDSSLQGLDVERVQGDVCDAASVRRAMDGVEVVYHLAARISIVGDPTGQVRAINVHGARNVFQAARECKVRRLVHCSSIHAFDMEHAPTPLDGTSPQVDGHAGGAYDRSKADGERELRQVIGQGLDAVVVNPTAVIGPADPRPSRMGLVFKWLYLRRLPALVPGGFDWVDVRDVVAGLMAAEARGRTGENYLLGGHFTTVRELAGIAGEITGRRAPRLTTPLGLCHLVAPVVEKAADWMHAEPLFTRESLVALRVGPPVNHEKAARELGHAPRPLRDTVRDLYAWFTEHGYLGAPAGSSARPVAP